MASSGGSSGGSAGGAGSGSGSGGVGAGKGGASYGMGSFGGIGSGAGLSIGSRGSGLGSLVNSNYGGLGRSASGIYGASRINASYKGPDFTSPIDYNGQRKGYSPLESSLSSTGKQVNSFGKSGYDSKNLVAMAGMYRMLNRAETEEELRKYLKMAGQYLR